MIARKRERKSEKKEEEEEEKKGEKLSLICICERSELLFGTTF